MLKAIGRVGEQNYLTDTEMMAGIRNIQAYIESNLKQAAQQRKTAS